MKGVKIIKPLLEQRLQRRYIMLVKSHLHSASKLAAGPMSLPSISSAFAVTQGAWRFLNNDRVTLPELVKPLREVACIKTQSLKSRFALLVHDWCKVAYTHRNKKDLLQLTHATDIGYDLTTALLVSADNGAPIAPMEMHLKTGSGFLSTRALNEKPGAHLEQVLPTMESVKSWNLGCPVVHVIDREADSVDHYRRWDAEGNWYLIRGDDRRVKWNGERYLLSEIRKELLKKDEFQKIKEITYEEKGAELWGVETQVSLYRPAKKNVKNRRYEVVGQELSLRGIFVEVRRDCKVLAEWILLSNVPHELSTTGHLAMCYYWRWKIENFFKLLKGHGQQLEEWQQESGGAIGKRLLIATMACVIVWQLQEDPSEESMEFKDVLVQLSGRQTKPKNRHTAPALLDGLGKMLSMFSLLEHYDLHQLKHLLANNLSFSSA